MHMHMKLCLKCNAILEKKSLSWPFDVQDGLDAWHVAWHSFASQSRTSLVVNGVSRSMLPIGLGLAQLKSNDQVYLAYYLWKQGLNNGPNFKDIIMLNHAISSYLHILFGPRKE